MNFSESRLNFLAFQNMDPAFVSAYAEHFAYINPWNAYWGRIKGTTIAASEEVSPAQNFARTEFYNDWLLPQNNAVAAAGMKLVHEGGEVVNLLVHYPLAKAGLYDEAALAILNNIRGNLERSVNLARLLRADVETAVAEAALVERGRGAAFIVDGDRRLREANRLAERLFASGHGVVVRHGRCHLGDVAADARFAAALEKLSWESPRRSRGSAFAARPGPGRSRWPRSRSLSRRGARALPCSHPGAWSWCSSPISARGM